MNVPFRSPMLALLLAPEPSEPPATPRIELRWHAPEACPDHADVLARTEALLMDPQAHAVADAEVVASGDGFDLTLRLAGHADAPQQHHARDCNALADVAALVVAVAADPTLALRDGGPPPIGPLQPEPPPPEPAVSAAPGDAGPPELAFTPGDDPLAIEATPRDDPGPTAPRRPPLGGFVGVHGLLGRAELPGLDAGVGIVAAVAWRRLRGQLGGSYLAAQRRSIPAAPPVHANLRAWNATVAGCADLMVSRVRVGPCVGVELGVVSAIADDAASPQRNRALWIAATAGLALRWPADERVQLAAGVEGVVALRRPSFALRDLPRDTVVTGPGGIRATLGFAVAWGHLRRNWRPDDPNASRRR